MKTMPGNSIGRIAAGLCAGRGAGLADQDRQDRRAVRAGLDARHGGAADRRPAAAEARPALRDREQAGRQRQSRDRRGGQGRARRRHHRHLDRRAAGHQHLAVLQAALRPGQGHRADHAVDHRSRARWWSTPSLGVNTVAELVALLKREPGKYNFGSIGNGSLSHLAMEAIALKSGTKMVHIPYPGLAAGDDRGPARRRADGLPAGDRGDAARRLRQGEDPGGLARPALGAAAGLSRP